VVALGGCGLFDDGGGDGETTRSSDPASAAGTADLAAALQAEEALLSAYRTAVEQHPGLRSRLQAARADHEEHRRVLLTLLADLDPSGPWSATLDPAAPTARSAPAAGASATGSPSPAPAAGPAASDPEQALAALRDLEREAASERTEQAVRADSGWAPLLGVLAASEASHAAVLAA
jgi:hypothetical protein